jgi:hypothetical protein
MPLFITAPGVAHLFFTIVFLCNIFKMEGGLSPIKRRICNKIEWVRALCRERDGILSGVEILINTNSECGALRHRTSASKISLL